MTHIEYLLNDLANEIAIIKHLHSKINEEDLNFSPAQGMRTVQDLLDYLRVCSLTVAQFYLGEEQTPEKMKKQSEKLKAEAMAFKDFDKAMDFQFERIEKLFENVSDKDLKERIVKNFLEEEVPLGEALQHTVFKYLPAYRMQLFLYLKISGKSNLNTFNNWLGIDPPPRS